MVEPSFCSMKEGVLSFVIIVKFAWLSVGVESFVTLETLIVRLLSMFGDRDEFAASKKLDFSIGCSSWMAGPSFVYKVTVV